MFRFLLVILLSLSACDYSSNGANSQAIQPLSKGNVSFGIVQTFTNEFMDLINHHRIDIGLRPLLYDEGLGILATHHSLDMATGAVAFGHLGFSERCLEAKSLLDGGSLCAENVALGQKSPSAVFTSWMKSPGHRSNIEQSRVTHTGFGFAQSRSGVYYWTQIFIELN
jgi:uncharacterized protein YkwD